MCSATAQRRHWHVLFAQAAAFIHQQPSLLQSMFMGAWRGTGGGPTCYLGTCTYMGRGHGHRGAKQEQEHSGNWVPPSPSPLSPCTCLSCGESYAWGRQACCSIHAAVSRCCPAGPFQLGKLILKLFTRCCRVTTLQL